MKTTVKNRLIAANLLFAAVAATCTFVATNQPKANTSQASMENLPVVQLSTVEVIPSMEEISAALNQSNLSATISYVAQTENLPAVQLAIINVTPSPEDIAAIPSESNSRVAESSDQTAHSTSLLNSAKASLPRINWDMPFYSFSTLLPHLNRD